MIKYLAAKAANYVAKNDESADVEVLTYGFDLILQEIGVLACALVIALPFGLLIPVALSIVSYNLVRRYAGGTHASHRAVCISSSLFTMFGPAAFFDKAGFHLPISVMLGAYAAGLLLLFLYAPADTEIKPVTDVSQRRSAKIKSLLSLTLCTGLALLLRPYRPGYADVLVVVPLIVCCLTHPWAYKLYGCEKSNILTEETK